MIQRFVHAKEEVSFNVHHRKRGWCRLALNVVYKLVEEIRCIAAAQEQLHEMNAIRILDLFVLKQLLELFTRAHTVVVLFWDIHFGMVAA